MPQRSGEHSQGIAVHRPEHLMRIGAVVSLDDFDPPVPGPLFQKCFLLRHFPVPPNISYRLAAVPPSFNPPRRAIETPPKVPVLLSSELQP